MTNVQSIVESIAQDLKKPTSYPVDKLSQATPVAKYLPALLIVRAAIRENKSKPVVFSPPIIEHQDRALIYRRTINVIQGQNGSHKSGLVGILVSTLISSLKIDLAGFSSKKDIQTVVCIADTERNISEQLPFAIQNMQVKAGFHISEHPANLDYISLLDVSRSERFQALQEYIEVCTTEHQGKHLLIVLDV
jgi:predicted ATPase